eukprot:5105547-Pyramimonas_sp.AAC.1
MCPEVEAEMEDATSDQAAAGKPEQHDQPPDGEHLEAKAEPADAASAKAQLAAPVDPCVQAEQEQDPDED